MRRRLTQSEIAAYRELARAAERLRRAQLRAEQRRKQEFVEKDAVGHG